jgi:hypothetical protein
MQNKVLFNHKVEWNYVIGGKMNHDVKLSKPDWEKQISLILSHIWNPNNNKRPDKWVINITKYKINI